MVINTFMDHISRQCSNHCHLLRAYWLHVTPARTPKQSILTFREGLASLLSFQQVQPPCKPCTSHAHTSRNALGLSVGACGSLRSQRVLRQHALLPQVSPAAITASFGSPMRTDMGSPITPPVSNPAAAAFFQSHRPREASTEQCAS